MTPYRRALIANIIAWLAGIIWILPFIGILMTSIRPFREVIRGWWIFEEFNPSISKYIEVLGHPSYPLYKGIINSFIVAIPSTLTPIVVAALSAYAFTRFSFPLKNYLFLTMLILMTVPQQMMIIPIFFMLNGMRLLDTYLGLIIVHSSWGIPWLTFFLKNYFSLLPREVEEAALVDGADYRTIFFRIVLPMALPGIISAAVLQFAWVWNDFFFALMLIYSPDKMVSTQMLPLLKGQYHIDWGLLSAGSVLVMSIPVLVYAVFHKYYIKGFTAWALKG